MVSGSSTFSTPRFTDLRIVPVRRPFRRLTEGEREYGEEKCGVEDTVAANSRLRRQKLDCAMLVLAY